MNRNRILIGGLAAGVFLVVCDFVGHGMILRGDYMALGQEGKIHAEPQIPFLPLLVLSEFAVGIAMAWLYAVARPRLGAGPKAAILIALALIVVHVPGTLSKLSWDMYPMGVTGAGFLIAAIQAVGGTLIAGFFYKEAAR